MYDTNMNAVWYIKKKKKWNKSFKSIVLFISKSSIKMFLFGGNRLYLSVNTVSKVKLVTVVEGDQKAPFSITTTPRCRGGRYSFPWIAQLYPWYVPLYCWVLSKEVSSAMNTLPTRPMRHNELNSAKRVENYYSISRTPLPL